MATISAVNTAASTYPTRLTKPDRQDPIAKVAAVLGLDADELKDRLKDGATLNDVAEDQGVTKDELIAAIKRGLPADDAEKPAGAPPPSPPPGGPKGENAALQDPAKLGQLSQLLQMDSSEVTGQATSAAGLVSLLKSKGVDLTQLRSVLKSGDLFDIAA
ncbi:hypothetical protein BJ973_002737 [Actinoplanes tereljensis]|uniref:Uncharacterized protein n=1 Tax=Paractinoplanes tereljensis TaxID=571912 RepID=A0A919TUK7_9ACTN|nr:hypothetical protein [Actinoplanes tereljensis]GIF22414.1 hypothetical protein Ate02nite_51440 [Actinoplanes tereljensis]